MYLLYKNKPNPNLVMNLASSNKIQMGGLDATYVRFDRALIFALNPAKPIIFSCLICIKCSPFILNVLQAFFLQQESYYREKYTCLLGRVWK